MGWKGLGQQRAGTDTCTPLTPLRMMHQLLQQQQLCVPTLSATGPDVTMAAMAADGARIIAREGRDSVWSPGCGR